MRMFNIVILAEAGIQRGKGGLDSRVKAENDNIFEKFL